MQSDDLKDLALRSSRLVKADKVPKENFKQGAENLRASLAFFQDECELEITLGDAIEEFIFALFEFEKVRSGIDYLTNEVDKPLAQELNSGQDTRLEMWTVKEESSEEDDYEALQSDKIDTPSNRANILPLVMEQKSFNNATIYRKYDSLAQEFKERRSGKIERSTQEESDIQLQPSIQQDSNSHMAITIESQDFLIPKNQHSDDRDLFRSRPPTAQNMFASGGYFCRGEIIDYKEKTENRMKSSMEINQIDDWTPPKAKKLKRKHIDFNSAFLNKSLMNHKRTNSNNEDSSFGLKKKKFDLSLDLSGVLKKIATDYHEENDAEEKKSKKTKLGKLNNNRMSMDSGLTSAYSLPKSYNFNKKGSIHQMIKVLGTSYDQSSSRKANTQRRIKSPVKRRSGGKRKMKKVKKPTSSTNRDTSDYIHTVRQNLAELSKISETMRVLNQRILQTSRELSKSSKRRASPHRENKKSRVQPRGRLGQTTSGTISPRRTSLEKLGTSIRSMSNKSFNMASTGPTLKGKVAAALQNILQHRKKREPSTELTFLIDYGEAN